MACGLCHPRCPTYDLHRCEAESPRGRIALVRGLAQGHLAATPALERHLSHCLGCRACEAACPSGVEYGRLLDAARAHLRLRPRTPRARLAVAVLGRYRRRRPYRSPAGAGRPPPRVQLFTGCATGLLDRETRRAAVTLLERLGFAVELPAGQVCCGALFRHYGAPGRAAERAARNLAAFGDDPDTPVLSLASGCGATLSEYAGLLPGPAAAAFAARHRDLVGFLAALDWPGELRLRPLAGRLWVHEPCTLRNVLGGAGATYELLGRLPGADPRPLPGNDRCCGGAGLYPLLHPRIARSLRGAKARGLAGKDGDWLVTGNLGCALQLRRAARDAGVRLQILHPVALLARQLAPVRQ